MPEGLSPEEAAAFPVSFLTAYLALKRAQARPGEKVLVQAAAGALGTAAVQVARAMGLRVLAAASGPKLALPLALGAEEAATYAEVPERAKAWGGLDLVLEVRGKEVEESLGLLAHGGGSSTSGPPRGRWPPSRPSASCAATWPSSASGSPPPAGGRPGGGGPGLPPPQARAGA